MKCDSCGDEIGNLGDDWVALGKSGDICTVCAAEEIAKLRAEVDRLRESARWRKWPEEVPEKTGYYTIHLVHMKYPVTIWFSVHSGWDVKYNSCWWIKLEMPKTETGGVGDGHIRNA